MSGPGYSRRAVAVGGGIAAALGLTALGVTMPRLLGHRYRRTPYDDLLAQLVDREAAVRLGQGVDEQIASYPNIDSRLPEPAEMAKGLREYMRGRSLADVTKTELAQGKLIEVKGWVLPETLVLLSLLAAHS
jgi:hypothetical protein